MHNLSLCFSFVTINITCFSQPNFCNLNGGSIRRCDSQPHGPTITIHHCLHVEKQPCNVDVEEENTCNLYLYLFLGTCRLKVVMLDAPQKGAPKEMWD